MLYRGELKAFQIYCAWLLSMLVYWLENLLVRAWLAPGTDYRWLSGIGHKHFSCKPLQMRLFIRVRPFSQFPREVWGHVHVEHYLSKNLTKRFLGGNEDLQC